MGYKITHDRLLPYLETATGEHEKTQEEANKILSEANVAEPFGSDDGQYDVYEIYGDDESPDDYPDGNPHADRLYVPKLDTTYGSWLDNQPQSYPVQYSHYGNIIVVNDGTYSWGTTREAWDTVIDKPIMIDRRNEEYHAVIYDDFCAKLNRADGHISQEEINAKLEEMDIRDYDGDLVQVTS